MLFSLLPTTALAADTYPTASEVCVDGSKYFGEPGSYYFKNNASACSKDPTGYNAYYNPTAGTLTLDGYSGESITAGGTGADITVVLKGTNTINGNLVNSGGGDITITSDSGGTLSITNATDTYSDALIGIKAGYGGSFTTGNVTIKGDAKVTITMTHNGTQTYDKAYGIFAKENITISEGASVDITCATPNNTGVDGTLCNGLRAVNDVIIDTTGKVKIDVTRAGGSNTQSYGIFPSGKATLTNVGEMEIEWKKHDSNSSFSGAAILPKGSGFDTSTHAVNVDTTNCYASYRKGTPHTVTVKNGTLTGPGVKYANESGNFLAGDTVNITPNEKKSSDGTLIPFKEWTSENVALSNPTTENNSFTVPDKDVTVTAMHSPFVGTPMFTRTDDSSGTIEFKTAVKPDDGTEYFQYVEVGEENDPYAYNKPYSQLTTISTASPYEYSVSATNYNSGNIRYLDAGEYRMAVTLNSERYLSDPFTVNYTAAPVPTANISLDKTGTVDFGSVEESYTAAPAAQTVTITNSGTAATGPLTIALDGVNASSFKLDKTSIANIAASGKDTFTVQPKTGLSAGTHTATVKVSGTGVTEQSFDVKFTVTAAAIPIAVPTAKSVTYDGTKQTGVSGGTGYTLGGVYEAIDVGAANYAATATLNTGYKWTDGSTDVKTITWNIGKRTPTAADFTFAPPTPLTYDGYNKTASVTLKSPLTNSGAITVKYAKGSADVTETKDVGEYTVKIDVAGGDNFNAASKLTASAWKFSITPANQNAPTGLGVKAPTTNTDNGKITGTTTDMEYHIDANASAGWTACSNTETAVAPGTYYVRFKAKTNYNAGAVSAALVVPDYSATKYTVTVTYDTNGTANADKISAVTGETVTLTATPNSGYVFDKWADKTPNSLTIGTDGKFIMPIGDVSVKATFKGAALTGTASITGDLKYGKELTATLTGDNNTGNLDYKWYQDGTTQVAANNTGKYTLTADDIGKTITVKISSDVQTGEITSSATGTIEKADAPAAPAAFTLKFKLNSDGKTFTATIPTVAGGEYSFNGTDYSTTNTKTDCTANTEYTGYVRLAETNTHKVSDTTSDKQTSPKLTVATPTFKPNGVSSFSGTQSVTISCDTADAKIYYTTDGKEPTASDTEYTNALTLTSTTTLKAIAVKADMNDSAIATATFTKASGGGGGSSGGSYVPKTQKPEIKAAAGGKTVLSKDGTTLTITADAGKVIDKVLLNGKDMGAASELKGLKTGDKVEVIFKDQVTEPTKEQLDKAAKEAAGDLVLTARSAKLKNGSVKVMLKGDLKAITDAGYTVKYKFYRSTKKSAGYKAVLTKKAPSYVNTYGKQGTMYYYKARVMIYDKDGNFVAQTALKQCKYASRLWTK